MIENYHTVMDKYAVVSDIHGDSGMLKMLINRAIKESAKAILCLGDIGLSQSADIVDSIRSSSLPFSIVRGNCDSAWDFSNVSMHMPPKYKTVELGDRTIFFTHGDSIKVWHDAPVHLLQNDIFAFGHTHVPILYRDDKSPWILNPGSASRPRCNCDPSMAFVTNEEIRIVSILTGMVLKKGLQWL